MAIAFLDKGQHQLLAGSIDGSQATDAALTTADGAASMARDSAGLYTVTFGAAFLSAPVCVGTVVDATFAATDGLHSVEIASVAATDVQFRIVDAGGSAADGAVADLDFHFMCVGPRNR